MKNKILCFLVILSTLFNSLYSQIDETITTEEEFEQAEDISEEEEDPCTQIMDKKSEKAFKKAREFQKKGRKDDAVEIYLEILAEHPDYLEVNYYYGLSYYLPIELSDFQIKDIRQVQKALEAFNRIYTICPYYKIHYNLYAARLAYLTENFPEAVKFAKVITENIDLVKKDEYIEEAELIIKRSGFFAEVLNNPVPFDPKPVEGISTQYDEYLACISPDGEQFYFTRRQPYQDRNKPFADIKEDREFFSMSSKDQNQKFGPGGPLPHPFNISKNEGSPAINITNDFLIFSKMVLTAKNYPNYDLYYSEYIDGEWTAPKSLGSEINHPDSWESQPSLSSDGKTLFFASDRPGGYGGSDIWYSTRRADGSWQKPINLGPRINTKGNERSPFLHTDSKTLYFSSSGHAGLGGLDIFYSRFAEGKGWAAPVNIGYPINSENDEVDFFVSLDGKTGYFSSNNFDKGNWNIYQFSLYEEAQPGSMIIIKGVSQSDDGDLTDAIVEIRDTASNVLATAKINENSGKYAVATEVKNDTPAELIVNIKKSGYSYDTKLVNIKETINNVITSNAEVKKVEVGKIYDLHDIYFATNEYSLTSKSKRVIDLFIEFLKENPEIKVEIQGHTDNIGNDKNNQLLSERRAESVYHYVIEKGISSSRVRYKGYGKTMPIESNDTAEGRAKNRRTVFLIYEK